MCERGWISIMIFAIALMNVFAFTSGFNVTFDPPTVKKLYVDDEINVTVSLRDNNVVRIVDDDISLQAEPYSVLSASFLKVPWKCDNFVCNRTMTVNGHFLGFGKIFLLQNQSGKGSE